MIPRRQHEVRRHGSEGTGCFDLGLLLAERGEHFVGVEPFEIDGLRGVVEVLGCSRGKNVLPVTVLLRPECRGPGRVEGVESAVRGSKPAAEGNGSVWAVVDCSVLIVD